MKNSNKIRYVIGIDPSGNFNEGKGTTGLAVYDRKTDHILFTGAVSAKDFINQVAYWSGVIAAIKDLQVRYKKNCLAIEDYLLYETAARSQINSTFETPQLIGVLKYVFTKTDVYLRPACRVKKRWTDEILLRRGYLYKDRRNGYYIVDEDGEKVLVIIHARDAIRHAVHCGKFEIK